MIDIFMVLFSVGIPPVLSYRSRGDISLVFSRDNYFFESLRCYHLFNKMYLIFSYPARFCLNTQRKFLDDEFHMKEEDFDSLKHMSIGGVHFKRDLRPWRKMVE